MYKTPATTGELRYYTTKCYAGCVDKACGVRDRRPEGGMVEAACKRHADSTIKAFAACSYCGGRRPSMLIDGHQLAHKACDTEARL